MPSRRLFNLCAGLRAASRLVSTHSLAPLHEEGDPDQVPGQYIVAFKPGYTVEEHWQNIGRNVSSFPEFVHYDELSGYAAEMVSDLLFAWAV